MSSHFDNKTLPPWEHQEEFDRIVATYLPVARISQPVARFLEIKGTTGNYYDALRVALPEALHPELYRGFPLFGKDSFPFYAVAHSLRDSQYDAP